MQKLRAARKLASSSLTTVHDVLGVDVSGVDDDDYADGGLLPRNERAKKGENFISLR
jgi:hypothetical protein